MLSDWLANTTAALSGTSMACAIATGAGALLLGGYPASTPTQVGNGILDDATVGALSNIGTGSSNLLLYVLNLLPGSSSSPLLESSSSSSTSAATASTTSRWWLLCGGLLFL